MKAKLQWILICDKGSCFKSQNWIRDAAQLKDILRLLVMIGKVSKDSILFTVFKLKINIGFEY